MIVQLATFLSLFVLAFSAPNPTLPGPSDTPAAGSQCMIQWTADPTGKWTNMNIELMTGPNAEMIHMRTIGTVNAVTNTSYTWTCPQIVPPAPIVFYQFSDQVDPSNTLWTGRFTITNTDGTSQPAPSTDSGGIAYGNATFENTSLYNAQPPYLVGNGQLIQTAGPSSQSLTGASSIPPSTGMPTNTMPGASSSSQSVGSMSTVIKPLSSAGTSVESTGTSTSTSTTSPQPGAALGLSVPDSTYLWITLGALTFGITVVL